MTTIENPTFTTAEGVTFNLKQTNQILFQSWSIMYKKLNPRPVPPDRVVTIGVKDVVERNSRDEFYLIQVADYEEALNLARVDYVFAHGIKDDPPDKWEPLNPALLAENAKGYEVKALWIIEQLPTLADIDLLSEAILSLSGITDDAIAEAEKN